MDLHIITHEIDATLCHTLFSSPNQPLSITTEKYQMAYQAAQQHEARLQQLNLSLQLAHYVDRYLNKGWVYTAFRFARQPAHAAKLSNLYLFMEKAFRMIRLTPDLKKVVTQITNTERAISFQLASGQTLFETTPC